MQDGTFLRICDYIFVLRPLILIPAWSLYLIGAGEAIRRSSQSAALFPSPRVFICLTAILITAYLLNQIFDRESDERNRKCFYLSQGIFGVRTLLVLSLGFYLVASFTFRRLDEPHRIPLIAALILSLTYSLPPFRLCARPFLDLLANAVGFGGIAFILGYGLFFNDLMESAQLSLPYVLLVAATFLHTTVLDVEGDRETGKISTSVRIGIGPSKLVALVLHGFAVAAAISWSTTLAIVITATTLPFTAYALKSTDRRMSSVQAQAATLIVTLGAVLLWPVYIAILLPLVILSRYYHQRRFGIIYPGLRKNS
ncbi:MAG: hypothetical protein GTO42_02085 [Candidatus Latescibacteria bacterium]|nr:hypothetical protein [Candidatus Latescibacterota bacterium]NIO27321.1 hypothetical protein [Candidatus Latescibacterota bacterium]NIO54845.1 hypothetical protein [Candidatus Latescibacterota bacterium]NIT00928.1 hypothetical protein [Candidatus Latescibacterota bacterium]NIT37851.1 hypothetical protein [Candidatus Latescibacterota bacterium]